MSPMVKQPLTTEYALLGFLRQQPMHAYEIHQTLLRNEALGLVWHLKQSLVYVMLERLEAEGYIDPGGSSPAWAVNFVQGKGPYANMIGMGRMLALPKYKDKDQKEPNPYKFFE